MSVFFSNRGINGDHIGVINPAARDKVLAAIYELKLFGPSLNYDNRCPRMSPQTPRITRAKSSGVKHVPRPGQHKRISHDQVDKRKISKSSIGCSDQGRQFHRHSTTSLPDRTSPLHGALKEKLKCRIPAISTAEKGSVKVYVKVLHKDIEYKTIDITTHTTSEQLVAVVLDVCDAFTKDPNVYYIAMETGIKRKDSGLPISKMIVLDSDARPLELQSCQPQGETKFHLKMKSGGLVRVRANVLCPEATYKTMYIARNTTARQLIKLIIKSCNSDESPGDFLLRESSADFGVDRMLEENEYPLEIQSHWKAEEDVTFFLTRNVRKVSKSPSTASTKSVPREQEKDTAKPNHALDILQETIARLRQGKYHEKRDAKDTEDTERRTTESSIDSGYGKSDSEQLCEHYMAPIEECDPFGDEADQEKRRKMVETLRQRRTSIDALDLHNVPSEKPQTSPKRRISQIERFRNKFFEFQKSEIDALDLHDNDKVQSDSGLEAKPQRRVSQIDRFRNKFMEYYHEKSEEPHRRASSGVPHEKKTEALHGRSLSFSDADALDMEPQFFDYFKEAASRSSLSSNSSEHELRHLFTSSPSWQDNQMRKNSDFNSRSLPGRNVADFSLFRMLDGMQLVAVSLSRKRGKELGLELSQVTQTGPTSDKECDEDDVVYVLHDGEGHNSVVSSPTEYHGKQSFVPITGQQHSPSDSDDSLHEEERTQPCAKPQNPEDLLHEAQKRQIRRKLGVSLTGEMELVSDECRPPLSRPGSACGFTRPTVSLEPRPSSALAHIRRRSSAKPSPGVCIVGITQGSVADESGALRDEDLIVEVNGKYVVNSTLDDVIATLQLQDTVHLVVAREKTVSEVKTEATKTESPEPAKAVPSYHADLQGLTQQVQQLVTMVTEMQEALAQKDKTISSLKKALVKKKLKLSSKDKILDAVQVLV